MDLVLLSADKARLFGLHERDQTDEVALAELRAQGCTEADARDRLNEAITAGAFARGAARTDFRHTSGGSKGANKKEHDA